MSRSIADRQPVFQPLALFFDSLWSGFSGDRAQKKAARAGGFTG
jgi:hypothetical protein